MAKGVISKIKQVTGCDDKYAYDMWQHISDVDNHMARKSLKWQTPLESFCGETPDLSIIRFKFYEPVWYREWSAKAGEILLFKGRFMGIAWNVGDALTYKVLVSDGKCEHMSNRSVVLPRNPNSNIPPNLTGNQIDNMFPKLVTIAEKCPTTVVGAEIPNHIEKVGMGSEQAIEDANISEASQDNSTMGEAAALEERVDRNENTVNYITTPCTKSTKESITQ